MKTNITQVCAAAIGTMLLAGFSLSADAQLSLTGTSYTQNFNAIASGLPTGWKVRTGATATALGTDVTSAAILTPGATTLWNATGGGFKNFASGTPFVTYASGTTVLQGTETNRALGVRQVSATDMGVAFVLELANTANLGNFDMSFNLQSLDSTSTRTATWVVDYGVGANPTAFTPATTTGTMTTGGNTFTKNTINVDFGTALNNQSGPVYIRIVILTATVGQQNRPSTAIDDVSLTWTGAATATNILATNYTPVGNNVPLATSQLTVKYNNPIAKGTGNFTLMKQGSATPATVVDVTSSAVTITNDSTAVISLGAYNLENNTHYYVQAGAGIFTKTGGTLPSLAIADTTTWAFRTVDTVTPPPPTPMTSLNETFAACQANQGSGVFTQFSETGPKFWGCSRFGRKVTGGTDTTGIYINGGSEAGVSEANKDWLITNAPLDFSAMSTPTLSFWQKKRFNGTATRTIKVSTDFVFGTDPTTATWTTLTVPALNNAPAGENTWSQVTGIDLTAYKNTPFYLAFTYECGTTGTYELTYDDIKVENATGIKTVKGANLGIQVLGEATTNQINLNVEVKAGENIELQLFDLLGRKVATQKANVQAGANRLSFTGLNLNAGMYVIRVISANGFGTVKAVVK
ncbi:MAG: T9SS type A sorting domain-containing protein [Sphingobacteriales bacterium]|nr:MAG: T9SS type A sorting domain-containing protein [Sphingobacteriales bacterium]